MQLLLRMLGPVMHMYIHTSRLDFHPSSCVPSPSCHIWINADFQGNFTPPDVEIVFESRSVRGTEIVFELLSVCVHVFSG